MDVLSVWLKMLLNITLLLLLQCPLLSQLLVVLALSMLVASTRTASWRARFNASASRERELPYATSFYKKFTTILLLKETASGTKDLLAKLEDLEDQAFLYLAPVTNMVGLVHHPHFDKPRGLAEGTTNLLWALEGLNLSPSVVACKPEQLAVVRISTLPWEELADAPTAAAFKALVLGTEPETSED